MLPVIALVGRPNVGKSTLFNRLTASRDALVADEPGLTRDRIYGFGRIRGRPCLIVDTGGLGAGDTGIEARIAEQTARAIDEADVIVMLVDARAGLHPLDETIAADLRRQGKPVVLAVNKAEGLDAVQACAEFHALALGEPQALSAEHGDHVQALEERLAARLPEAAGAEEDAGTGARGPRLVLLGRPNVGKSTLANRLAGDERVITDDRPGTTRDSVTIPFTRDGRDYVLIDTAGVRRRSRIDEKIERYSVIKALQAMSEADVVIAVLDAREGITQQDLSLLGLVLESGRALVIALNKWDGLDEEQRARIERDADRKLEFVRFAHVQRISALHGTGVGELLDAVTRAHEGAQRSFPTSLLCRILERSVHAHHPPAVGGRHIKLRFAHQSGRNPPTIAIHGNRTRLLPASYRRYLANQFRTALELEGTPVRIELHEGDNPYAPK